MRRVDWAFISLGVLLVTVSTCSESIQNPTAGKDLYIYSGEQLSQFFQDIHHPDFSKSWDKFASRNSDGTSLRFLNRVTKEGLILSCDGSVQIVSIPGYPVWFNDQKKVIAWHDAGEVYYKNGRSEKIAESFSPYEGPDFSGTYFIKSPRSLNSCATSIYSVRFPYQPLYNMPICSPRYIFFRNGKIHLFGVDEEDDHSRKEGYQADIMTSYILEVGANQEVVQSERIKIQRPESSPTLFPVVDSSPWNDDVLFLDIYDVPFRSIWYVFNMKTHKMKKVGKVPPSGGLAFFLQCDMLEKVRTYSFPKNKDTHHM